MTLDQLAIGQRARLKTIQPPLMTPEWGDHWRALGLEPGEIVELRHRQGRHALVLRVGATQLALRCLEARHLQVSPL